MRRRLQRIYWIGIALTLLMAFAAMFLLVRLKVNDAHDDLFTILEAASAWTLESNDDLQDLTESIADISPNLRVTFLMDGGMVLADSKKDAASLENHFDRQEIIEASQGGIGESLRLSETMDTLMLYAAKRISPQLILRLGYPVWEITQLLLAYGCGLFVLFLVLYIMQRHLIQQFAGSMTRQMDEVRRLLEGDLTHAQAEFPEFQPAMNNIAYLASRLKEDVQEVNRTLSLRSDFVANASHELRSPLTSIMGFAEMLDEGLADTPEEQALCVQTIRGECQRMLDVIEDILLLSRAERQVVQETELVDVSAVAQEICQALAPKAAQKEISLQVQGNMSMQAVEKDLWEILYNLTDNAVRYGRKGGYVRIGLSQEHGRIEVEDDGIGIDEKHTAHIFEQFYRVDEARDMAVGGTGLGLSIVRAIAQRHGGDVLVESAPGKGSLFIVQFNIPEEGK